MAITVISIMGSGCISDSMDEVEKYMEMIPSGHGTEYVPDINGMTVPLAFSQNPIAYEQMPEPTSFMHPGFDMASRLQRMGMYQGSTGVVDLSIRNEGSRDMFIYSYGIRVEENDQFISMENGITIPPGEERKIGMIGLEIPENTDTITIRPTISMLAQTKSGSWFDCKEEVFDEIELETSPLPEKEYPEQYSNKPYLFEKANDKVNSRDIGVRQIAVGAAKEYPGAYNIFQICSLFDYTKENIQYISDPRGGDYWADPNETLQVGAGDCDDYATLMAALIEAIGGTSRIYLTDDHAFAAAYIGNDTQHIEEIAEAIRQYHGPVPVYYTTDEYGSWLMLDPTSSMYPGDLPGGTAPTKDGWTYLNTTTIRTIDIIPG